MGKHRTPPGAFPVVGIFVFAFSIVINMLLYLERKIATIALLQPRVIPSG
jgi:hypothetical protein